MTPLAASCSHEFYKASRIAGKRPLNGIRLIVWHDEEASTARSAAIFFHDKRLPRDGGPAGSAHLCVDDNECYRCLANEDIPWGAPGANEQGFHIEQAGFAKWSAVIWKKHINTLRRCAYKTALHCKQFDIPVQFVDAAGLKAGKKGITTHREVSKAFGGDHSDPGPFYPTPLVMWLTRRYYTQL